MIEALAPLQQRSGLLGHLRAHRRLTAGILILLVIVLVTVLGPWIWTKDAGQIDILAKNQGPSLAHPAGTDQLGRDLLAALLQGGRISLLVGGLAMIASVALGTIIGVMAGVVKWLDAPLMRMTDLFLALPLLPLLLVILMLWRDPLRAAMGAEAGILTLLVVVISLTSWMQTARVLRAETRSLIQRDFVLAARAIGATPARLARRHILPNITGPILVSATLAFANAIITESALSFLGLGFPSDVPSWGRLLFEGTNYMSLTPARVIWPGLAITLTVLSVNYVADGVRDKWDPRA